jgi:aerobic C4-dicarboxylate transport protein
MSVPIYRRLYFYVIIAILGGIVSGIVFTETASSFKSLSDLFIRLIRMIIGPVIFITVTLGIGNLTDLKKAGRIGLKAVVYFEVITTFALIIGLVVVNIVKPGEGMNINPASLDTSEIRDITTKENKERGFEAFLNAVIPSSITQPFADGNILQILFLAVLTGTALAVTGRSSVKIKEALEEIGKVVFKIVSFIMYLAPIGAFGAMAFTIGKFGADTLQSLIKLMLSVYITCFLFIVFVLGAVARISGFSLRKFIFYIKDEILVVLGTSSSESVLPQMMDKMEKLGCAKSVTGLVIPTGYSFNLDGTSIYLTMAAVFIAQATNTPLGIGDQIMVLLVLMLTSKGAAAVTGGGLVTLAATLATLDQIPVAGLTLLIGVDRFMSEARAITNLIGNGVATVAISNWEKEIDNERIREELGR